ncbi:tRNA nucleotidyltransferase/poly(A) polymerase family protein [Dethiobacter alkaliphilus]|uniref:hypothetical protein n=1 Tax=Dethiobacter alkaliphilus TaxID=427926 RepID=UPI0022277D95|nr:hypothetical protein [Dethiobacter alkaliphilus]MCW3489652.1 hypothetical protein [Dethiobacter alkaliphilus]
MRTKLLALADLAQKEQKEIYIVGGFVRDALRGIPSWDVDLVVTEEAEQFAKRAAWRMRGEYEMLDSQSQYSRIFLVASDGRPFSLDLTLVQVGKLEDDLKRRDFTVNAMAVSLNNYLHAPDWQESVIDPCGGKEDLHVGRLRLTTEECILRDPVRLFRSARFLLRLGLQFCPDTLAVLKKNAGQIRYAQKMKLSMELFQLLAQPYAADGMKILQDELDVLTHFFAPFARMNQVIVEGEAVFAHGLEVCRALEKILGENYCLTSDLLHKLHAHLRQKVAENRPRLSFLRLACILHDIGKVDGVQCERAKQSFNHEIAAEAYIGSLAQRLCFTQEEEMYLVRLICNHSRPLYTREVDLGANLRFFRQFGDTVPELVLLSMANLVARQGMDANRCRELCCLLDDYFAGKYASLPEPVISAREIMEFFNLPPTRAIGKYLEAVYAAQLEGRVKNSGEALSLVSILLEARNKGGEDT